MTPILNYRFVPCVNKKSADSLIILHGLFGSSRNWQSLAQQFAQHFNVILPDLRNHGDSFHCAQMDYPSMASDVLDLVDDLQLDRMYLLGHSMGGKAAMQCVKVAPQRWIALVVADIAPVAYQRDYDSLIDPVLQLDLGQLENRRQVEDALASSIPDAAIRMLLLQNLKVSPGHGLQWKLNWSALKQHMPDIVGYEPLDEWHISVPTLFIRGALSDHVPDDVRPLIQAHFSNARLETLQEAGHWLHADQPGEFLVRVLDFLQG